MTFSDSRIAKMLMNDFIPVWESVSPVRVVTFDLGEGRKLKGSVSGEIAIYFCDTDGKVFDILPALQSPAATLNAMKEAKVYHSELKKSLAKVKEEFKDQHVSRSSWELENKKLRTAQKLHKNRMKKVLKQRYPLSKNIDDEKMTKLNAERIFPNSAEGEAARENYINEAVDGATVDMRRMVLAKAVTIGGGLGGNTVTASGMTVVEPGGRGYYQWKVGQGFHGVWLKGYDPRNDIKRGDRPQFLMTPDQWKKALFEGILKQELKGGEVEYNSDSLRAINLFEE